MAAATLTQAGLGWLPIWGSAGPVEQRQAPFCKWEPSITRCQAQGGLQLEVLHYKVRMPGQVVKIEAWGSRGQGDRS